MEKKVEKALAVSFFAEDLTPPRWVTLREWLADLLLRVWEENEGFSGKRPWGNSGWDWDAAPALIASGLVNGSIDDDGYIDSLDNKAYDALIKACIQRMSKP